MKPKLRIIDDETTTFPAGKANVVEDNIYTMSAYVTSPSPISFGILRGIIDRIINGWK